jgi:hypothetical protein
MPLAFESVSHGHVAFGFFNIESDMLLLERCFFFADDFCRLVLDMARSGAESGFEAAWQVYRIAKLKDIGDLQGAIHGTRHIGFIGKTYRKYPFPRKPEDFKQNPQGFQTRAEFTEMVGKCADKLEIQVSADPSNGQVAIGDYVFSRESFLELVRYVWRGGYPRWRDETRPDYVEALKKLEVSGHWLFEGLRLS